MGRMGGKTTFIKGIGGKTYWKHRLEDLRIEERIILKWTEIENQQDATV